MAINLGALAADFSLGAVPVSSISLGAVLVWPPASSVPAALDTDDWAIDDVAVGPTVAEVIVSIPEDNATAVRWLNFVGSPWNSAVNIGGDNWRLLAANGNPLTVADGTHSGFKVSYQQEGTDWSPESVDAKSVTFDEAVITPDVATVTVNLNAGSATSLDVVATDLFVAAWPMEFRTTAGANIPHLWSSDGRTVTWHPAFDATPGSVETTITAYWQGDMPVVLLPEAPRNLAPPSVAGELGGTLTAEGDVWSSSYIRRDYVWKADGVVVGFGPTFDSEGYEAMEVRVEARVWVRDGTNEYVWNVSATAVSVPSAPFTFDSTIVTFDSTVRTLDEVPA